jgi:triosephosphate isomerase (TIM)
MRRKIIAGNWKMNLLPEEGQSIINNAADGIRELANNEFVIFCPSFVNLFAAGEVLAHKHPKNFLLGAQNCHPAAKGAYTGEVSISMLQALGVQAVIIGHSERRAYFNESNAFIKEKVNALLAAGLIPIFCCGEPLEIREAGTQNDYVLKQIQESLFHLASEQLAKVVIAYEPIWAIGTGVTATSNQAQEMHASIRAAIANEYSAEIADDVSILYGGSCNPTNAAELFALPDVDGGLIGGASINAEQWVAVCNAMS